jgi:hypothetical protein
VGNNYVYRPRFSTAAKMPHQAVAATAGHKIRIGLSETIVRRRFCSQPSAVSFDTSTDLRGTPSGLVGHRFALVADNAGNGAGGFGNSNVDASADLGPM